MEMQLLESLPSAKQWQSIGCKHHHGICTPLFSLVSTKSCGIGEFFDLIPLINWCQDIGLDVVQLLPLNDSGQDASPYNALSANALNPIFLSLHALPFLDEEFSHAIKQLQQFPIAPKISYSKVRLQKDQFLRNYYAKVKDKITQTEAYQQFVQNFPWVSSYATFKALKQKHAWTAWQTWPQMNHIDPSLEPEAQYQKFLQYLCFEQMKEVKKHAESSHVWLKGDIPILISKDSADVWYERYLFHQGLSAGAPPDYYSAEGQNWGFPIYNWDAMEKEGFSWWKERLKTAENLYHMYRLDHIVGFFRIWAVPNDAKAIDGYFIPQDKTQWLKQGEKFLRMLLESSSLFPIGEDLGNIPPEVRRCMKALGICGTKVIRWERDWNGTKQFIPFNKYEPLSMTCVSTHDSDTLLQWWKNSPNEAKEYCQFKGWQYTKNLKPEYHRNMLWDSHHSSSLFHINLLLEYLALFPELKWPDDSLERINTPNLISENNWTYHHRLPLEEILSHTQLKALMSELIQ